MIWAGSLMRIGTLLLGAMSRRACLDSLIQPSSLPLFDIGLKVTIAYSKHDVYVKAMPGT